MTQPALAALTEIAASARRAATGKGDSVRAEVEHRLAALLRQSGTLLAGRINVINLDRVRAALGDRWPRLRNKVLAFVRAEVFAAIQPSDIFARYGEAQFVILFGGRDTGRAETACSGLADKIERFIATQDTGGERLGVMAAVGPIDGNLLLQMLEAAAAPKIELVEPATPDAAANVAPQPISDVFRYVAMWDVRREAISTYACFRETANPDGTTRLGYQVFEQPGDLNYVAQVDLSTLCRATRDLGALMAGGGRALVVAPVHAATLDRPAVRDWYVSACAALPQSIRQHLLLHVAGLPIDAPSSRISRLVSFVKPYCRAITLRSSLAAKTMSHLREAGVTSVAVELHPDMPTDDKLRAALERFAATAAAGGVKSIVAGVRSKPLALACVTAGFDFISGPVIGSADLRISALRRYRLDSLYH